MNDPNPSIYLYSTVPLPDGIVIGGPWPHTLISWRDGKGRRATKPEYDLFQALESANASNKRLLEALARISDAAKNAISEVDKDVAAVATQAPVEPQHAP